MFFENKTMKQLKVILQIVNQNAWNHGKVIIYKFKHMWIFPLRNLQTNESIFFGGGELYSLWSTRKYWDYGTIEPRTGKNLQLSHISVLSILFCMFKCVRMGSNKFLKYINLKNYCIIQMWRIKILCSS
jgi:hypothetical protein